MMALKISFPIYVKTCNNFNSFFFFQFTYYCFCFSFTLFLFIVLCNPNISLPMFKYMRLCRRKYVLLLLTNLSNPWILNSFLILHTPSLCVCIITAFSIIHWLHNFGNIFYSCTGIKCSFDISPHTSNHPPLPNHHHHHHHIRTNTHGHIWPSI